MKKLGIITLLCILATVCEAQIMGAESSDCDYPRNVIKMDVGPSWIVSEVQTPSSQQDRPFNYKESRKESRGRFS